jgi:hypothetical protein
LTKNQSYDKNITRRENRMSENKIIEEGDKVRFKNERTGKNLGLPEIVTVKSIKDRWVKLKEDRGMAELPIDIDSLELVEEEKI